MSRRSKVNLAGVLVLALAAGIGVPTAPGTAADRITLISTVTRVPNLPLLVGLRLLEREDQVTVTIKDVRASEAAVQAVTDGQGQLGIGFAPFFPAVEKGAPIVAVMEMSRPEAVIMAKREIKTPADLNGVRLGSHSPKGSMQVLVETFLKQHPAVKPNVMFIPEGSPARAQALLQGALDAAVFDLSSADVVRRRSPDGFHIIADFTSYPVSNSFLIANTEFVKKRPDLVQKVVTRVLESYRRGLDDPKFWVREGQSFFKDVPPGVLEEQLRQVAKIFDRDGGLSRLRGEGARENIAFQVNAGLLTGPAGKWKPEQFFATEFLEKR